jgi:hypothetical protein
MAAEPLRLRVGGWLAEQGLDLPLRLSLLLLLLTPGGGWEVRPFVLLLAGAGLVSSAVLRAPTTWLLLTLLTGWRVVADWPMSDNHAYLLCYWCLAVLLSRLTPAPGSALASSARLLLGFTFAFATLWKLALSPDYLDGTFFRVWLLVDTRFEALAQLVGGLSAQEIDASRYFLQPPPSLGEEHLPALVEPPSLRAAAAVLTWTAAALETLLAIVCLAPAPGRWFALRHVVLIFFCATTYAIAPVASFGWMLLAMGTAACPPTALRLRGAYVVCFTLLVLHDAISWATLVPN